MSAPSGALARRPPRSAALPFAVGAATAVLVAFVIAAGAAAVNAVTRQYHLMSHSTELADVVAESGRVQALVAQLADPRTNPAWHDLMRAELTASAGLVARTAQAWQRELARPTPGDEFAAAVTAADPALVEQALAFAAAAERAAAPDADLAPGQLIRGSVDGLYVGVRQSATRVQGEVSRRAAAAKQGWQHVVTGVLVGTTVTGAALVGLLLGPVRLRLAQQHADAEQARQAVESSLAQVTGALEQLDVAVLVTDGRERTRGNATARDQFAGLPPEPVRPADLAAALHLRSLPGQDVLGWAQLPCGQALNTGTAVTAELVHGDGADRRLFVVRAHPLLDAHGAVSGVVTSIQDVTEQRSRAEQLSRRVERIAQLSRTTASLLRRDDVRQAACDAARSLTLAPVAALFEPAPDGDLLRCTAAAGAELVGVLLPRQAGSPANEAFGGRQVWTSDGTDPGQVRRAMAPLAGTQGPPVAGAWVPVLSGDTCRAVLAVGFTEPTALADRRECLRTLAHDTAAALERAQVVNTIAADADADPVTGVTAEQVWRAGLPRAVFTARATGAPLSLLLLGLDDQDGLRARVGPGELDGVRRRTAAAWRQVLDGGARLGRYGDGFGVVLPRTRLDDARNTAEQLLGLVTDGCTCSGGIAEHHRFEDVEALRARTDLALWIALRAGPGQLREAGRA